MKKTNIFYSIVASVPISNLLDWTLSKAYDATLTLPNLKIAIEYLLIGLSYLAGPFGYGLIVGALIFCVLDLPYIGGYLRKVRRKRINTIEDNELAGQCEKISKDIFEHHTNIYRIHEDLRWNPSDSSSSLSATWDESRKQQAREHDRFQNKSGHEINSMLVKLKNKGVNVEPDDFKIIQWRLLDASVLFQNIASSLRSGSYLDGKPLQLKRDEDE